MKYISSMPLNNEASSPEPTAETLVALFSENGRIQIKQG